jgi:hypothetical protein
MPIQFENTFVNPNIQVKGTEIPLEQLEKTSNILQDRYDKSYENLTKFQEMAKQAEQMAHPDERGKVKEWVSTLQPQVDQMVKDDALHRVGWKTMAMASNAANNLKLFQDRATLANKFTTELNASQKLKGDAKEHYVKKLNQELAKTQYDPTKGTFDFQPVSLPKVVEDADVNESLKKYAMGWLANKFGDQSANMAFVNKGESIPGVGGKAVEGGVYNTKTGRVVEKVDYNEVLNNVKSMMEQDIPIQEMIKRDTEIYLDKHPNVDPNKVYNMIKSKTLDNATKAWANKASYVSDIREEDVKYDGELSSRYGGGSGEPPFNPLGFMAMPNEILTEKSLDAVNNVTKTVNESGFDKNGNFIGVSPGIWDKVKIGAEMLKNGALLPFGVPPTFNTLPVSGNSFNDFVPTYYQNLHKTKGLTQQQLFNQFQAERANNTKILTSDYIISGRGTRNLVDDNMAAMLRTSKFYDKEGNPASQEAVNAAIKGGVTFQPFTGKIQIGTDNNNSLTTVLGAVTDADKNNMNNYTQARMSVAKDVLHDLFDLNKGTATTTNRELPIYNKDNQLVGYRRFFSNKKGAMSNTTKTINGQKVIVPSDPAITEVLVDVNGNAIGPKKVYKLGDDMNPQNFIIDMLNESALPFSGE